MSHVNVTINGRQYRMACEDGQEDHLRGLAEDLDRRVGTMRESFGDIGEIRLAVMAALMVADELAEARQKLGRAEAELGTYKEVELTAADRAQATQAALVAALNAASERIEGVTRSLNAGATETVALG